MTSRWACSHCGAEGIVKAVWGDHTGDIIEDTHRDMSFDCHRENGTTFIFLSSPSPIPTT